MQFSILAIISVRFTVKKLKKTLVVSLLQEFLANNPSLTEIRSEILHYATFEQEIDELKPIIVVGALELHTGI